MKLRKLIINTFMSVLVTCCLLNLNASAEVMHLEGLGFFSYEINNNEATITFYQLDTISDKLTIPTQIDGYNVVGIGEKAFFMQPTIKEVTVPDSVKNIGAQALGYKEDYGLAWVKIYDFTIKGYTDTAAETYAKENGFTFIALDEPDVTTTTTVTTGSTTETTVVTTQIPKISTNVFTTGFAIYESGYVHSLKSPPDKTVYEIGDELDLTGLKVDLEFYDQQGGHHTVYRDAYPLDNPDFIVDTSDFDNSKAGTYKIKVSCADKFTAFYLPGPVYFEVTVNDPSPVTTTTSTSTTENTTTTTVTTTVTSDAESTDTETTPVSTTGTTTSTIETTTYIASDEELCNWAVKDYEGKTGGTPANAEIKYTEEGIAVITLIDAEGNVLDVYTIDPITGIGTDFDGEEVNLPQTGYSKWYQVLIVAAMGMIGVGGAAIVKSGIFRKKESNN